MNDSISEILKKCSRDEESFQELQKLYGKLTEQSAEYQNRLELLERSILNDYDSILITDLELDEPGPRIVYVNDGFTKMTGYEREEVIGRTPRILQGEKTDRKVLAKLKKRLQEGQPFFGHTVNYRKDGSEFVNQWDIHPLTDENGTITHWVSYQHDITERKRFEKTLVDMEVGFDSLHEEVKSTIVDLDENGNILMAHKAFRDMVQSDIESLKNVRIWDLLREDYAESFRKKFINFDPANFVNRDYDLTFKTPSGLEVEVIAKTKLLASNGHHVIRVKFNNRSLQKRIIEVLRKSNRDTSRVLEKKTDFGYKIVRKMDQEYVYLDISDSFSKITGIHENEIIGSPVRKMVASDDWPRVKKHLDQVMSGKSSTEVYEILTRGGQGVPVIDSANPVENSKKVEAVRGSVSLEISSEYKLN